MKECLHIIVKGKVQGVYFRAYTQKEAIKHNLNDFYIAIAQVSYVTV